jgi:hypothetical protein
MQTIARLLLETEAHLPAKLYLAAPMAQAVAIILKIFLEYNGKELQTNHTYMAQYRSL